MCRRLSLQLLLLAAAAKFGQGAAPNEVTMLLTKLKGFFLMFYVFFTHTLACRLMQCNTGSSKEKGSSPYFEVGGSVKAPQADMSKCPTEPQLSFCVCVSYRQVGTGKSPALTTRTCLSADLYCKALRVDKRLEKGYINVVHANIINIPLFTISTTE